MDKSKVSKRLETIALDPLLGKKRNQGSSFH